MAAEVRHQAVVVASSPEGRMKSVNLAAQLAAAETNGNLLSRRNLCTNIKWRKAKRYVLYFEMIFALVHY
jgi:hypothetical protein